MRVGRKAAGGELDGRTWDEFPDRASGLTVNALRAAQAVGTAAHGEDGCGRDQGVMTVGLQLNLRLGQEPRAVFSGDRVYRYRLVRVWDSTKSVLGVIMLNPSTADENSDDATIRRVIRFARAFGYGGIEVCNLYALRSRNPAALWAHDDPVGPDNDEHLDLLASERDLILLAWGANARQPRASHVARLVMRGCQERGAAMGVLGWTQGGQPSHPLYLPSKTVLECLTLSGADDHEDPRWGCLMMAVAA